MAMGLTLPSERDAEYGESGEPHVVLKVCECRIFEVGTGSTL